MSTDITNTMEGTEVVTDQQTNVNPHDVEKQEEAKLSVRYPAAVKPMAGHSAFLQKRLAKGQKYFDSGDYQMAKQTGKNTTFQGKPRMMPPILSVAPEIQSTGESMAVRKTSLAQPPSKLANSS